MFQLKKNKQIIIIIIISRVALLVDVLDLCCGYFTFVFFSNSDYFSNDRHPLH